MTNEEFKKTVSEAVRVWNANHGRIMEQGHENPRFLAVEKAFEDLEAALGRVTCGASETPVFSDWKFQIQIPGTDGSPFRSVEATAIDVGHADKCVQLESKELNSIIDTAKLGAELIPVSEIPRDCHFERDGMVFRRGGIICFGEEMTFGLDEETLVKPRPDADANVLRVSGKAAQ